LTVAIACVFAVPSLCAHDGPPFPIVSEQIAGSYRVSVWTDPDATDDGSAGGQFWVTIEPASGSAMFAGGVHATITITATDQPGLPRTAAAVPTRGPASPQFAALVMDHEGRFRVRVDVAGPLGPARVEADVDATYDLRPPPIMLVIYLVPFLVVGAIWVKVLLRKRRRA
jgi:hypothetical protein